MATCVMFHRVDPWGHKGFDNLALSVEGEAVPVFRDARGTAQLVDQGVRHLQVGDSLFSCSDSGENQLLLVDPNVWAPAFKGCLAHRV